MRRPPGTFEALSACRQLREVLVWSTNFGASGATLLCSQLQHHPALQRLESSKIGLMAADHAALKAIVHEADGTCRQLRVS